MDARNISKKLGFVNCHTHHARHDDFHFIWWRVLYPHLKVSTGIKESRYAFPKNHSFKSLSKRKTDKIKQVKKAYIKTSKSNKKVVKKTSNSNKWDMTVNATRMTYFKEIDKRYKQGIFTMSQAREAVVSSGLPANKWRNIYHYLKLHCKFGRGLYTFKNNVVTKNK